MYGDTEVLRRRAGQLREQGIDISSLADHLVAQAESVGWTGRAADSMRERVRERASHLRDAASRHENAADSLEQHVLAVEAVKDQIANVERKASALVTDAAARVAGVTGGDPSDASAVGVGVRHQAADEHLGAFDPPPPGHKDWLTVTLPGL